MSENIKNLLILLFKIIDMICRFVEIITPFVVIRILYIVDDIKQKIEKKVEKENE